MSLVWADFPSGQTGLYGTTTSVMDDGLYASVSGDASLGEDPDPNVTGNVLIVSRGAANGVGQKLRFILPSAQATFGMAARIWLPSLPSDNARPPFFRFEDGANAEIFRIEPTTTGALTVYYAGGNSTTASPVMVANSWQHIEVKVTISATVGTIEVRREGVPVLELTGLNTGTANAEQCSICSRNNGSTLQTPSTYYVKDWVIWDGSGSLNNDFFGSVLVYSLLTNSDVSLNWTPSTGATGFDLIDEAPPVDTDYIEAPDPAPAAAVMGLTNLPADVTSVRGLITIARAAKTDGGDGNLQVSLISNAVTGSGTDRAITTAYSYYRDVFETDPDTSAAWTPVAVDAIDIQFDRTL